MLNRVEVARQIQINHCGHAPHHTAPDLRQGAVRRPLRSKSVGVGAKIRLEDSFQDQLHCALHHAVADARNLKRSDFAICLRDFYPAVRHGLIPVCDEVFPHRRKKRRPPRRLDVREFLAIDPSGAAVALRYTVGLFEGLDLRHVHEEPPEAMRLVRLRLSTNPPPQLLQTDGRFCHFTPASPWLAEYSPVRVLPSGRVLLHAHHQCRVGGGALARWPPSAAQTIHAVFPHTAFTKTHASEMQSKESTESSSPARTRHTAWFPAAVASHRFATA